MTVRILSPLDAIKYTFVQRGTRIHKTVHYFMMEPTGGGLEDHDHEFEEVRWISFDEAPDLLSFETERSLVGLAASGSRRPDRRALQTRPATTGPAHNHHDRRSTSMARLRTRLWRRRWPTGMRPSARGWWSSPAG